MAKTRREVLTALAATTAASLTSAGTSAAAGPQIGAPAPGFTARDSKDRQHTLAAYRSKIVILEWTNHECPYTVKHYATGNMQALQEAAADAGAIWLSVVSSRPGAQGHIDGAQADQLTRGRKAQPTAVLLDPKGDLGKLYGARTTPHMYIINPTGKLVYMGAIDDQPSASHASIKNARNYVRDALAAMAAGRPIAAPSTRPYGCTVKY